MKKLALFVVALTLSVPSLFAQDNQAVSISPPQPPSIKAPSPDASYTDLEQQGDQLRVEKAYLDAIDYYQAALKKAPKGAPASILYNKTGIAQLQLNRFPEARKSFEKSIKTDKTYSEAYNNLGVVYYRDQKYGRAIKLYKKAIHLHEESSSFHSNLGTAYFARKELDKAVVEYQRALQLDPEVFERHSQAGVAAQMQSPEDRAHYYYVVAKMYAQNGVFDRSLLYLRKAIEEGYKDIDNVYKDGEFAAMRKDPRFNELMAQKPLSIPQ